MQRTSWGLGIALLTLMSGCYDIQANIEDQQMQLARSMHASRAWRRCKGIYHDVDHRKHFGDGFCAGYADVASGGAGCAPTLPPRKYWSVWYQNPSGQRKVQAWFEGFAHGALAAEQEGAGAWGTILTNQAGQACMIPEGAEHEIFVEGYDGYVPGMGAGPMVVPPGVPPGIPPAPAAEPIDMTVDPVNEAYYFPSAGEQFAGEQLHSEQLDGEQWEMPVQSAGAEGTDLPPGL